MKNRIKKPAIIQNAQTVYGGVDSHKWENKMELIRLLSGKTDAKRTTDLTTPPGTKTVTLHNDDAVKKPTNSKAKTRPRAGYVVGKIVHILRAKANTTSRLLIPLHHWPGKKTQRTIINDKMHLCAGTNNRS